MFASEILYSWYCSNEFEILADFSNAINALEADTQSKMDYIVAWEERELQSMQDYYNDKVGECNNKIDYNNDLINVTVIYYEALHLNRMYPSIDDLTEIETLWKEKIQEAINGGELSAYAGEVDAIMSEIKDKANSAIDTIEDISDILEHAQNAMCIALGGLATACGVQCGAGIAASCVAATQAINAVVGVAVDTATEQLNELIDDAEAPEIDDSTTTGTSGVSNDEAYTDDSEYEASDDSSDSSDSSTGDDNAYDSGDTSQTNPGEGVDSDVGISFTTYLQLLGITVDSFWFYFGLIDAVLIYRFAGFPFVVM